MARIRTIKPSLWDSEKLGRCSILARLNFIGLISMADDEGRGRGETRFLLGRLHPYDSSIDEAALLASFKELEKRNLVVFYTVDECRYYALPGWRSHQYIEKGRKSDLPPIPNDDPLFPLLFPSSSPTPILRNGMEGNGMDGKTDAPSASDSSKSSFNEYRLKIGGEFKGVYVTSLIEDTARRALATARPGALDRAALTWWVKAKEEERTGKRSGSGLKKAEA